VFKLKRTNRFLRTIKEQDRTALAYKETVELITFTKKEPRRFSIKNMIHNSPTPIQTEDKMIILIEDMMIPEILQLAAERNSIRKGEDIESQLQIFSRQHSIDYPEPEQTGSLSIDVSGIVLDNKSFVFK
jgi:hypothetical protein